MIPKRFIIFVISFMSRNNISFVRLDGTLSQQQREKVIKQFSEDSDTQVLTYFLMFVCYLDSMLNCFNALANYNHQYLFLAPGVVDVAKSWWSGYKPNSSFQCFCYGTCKSVSVARTVVYLSSFRCNIGTQIG